MATMIAKPLLLLMFVAFAARAAPDAVAINWFPKASDIGAAITRPFFLPNNSLSEAECTGASMSCAFPDTWLPTSQQTAKAALPGYSLSSPLKIAIKSYGVDPRIYFIPTSPLLQPSADVTTLVRDFAAQAAATRRRKLHVADSAMFIVTSPGSWSYSVQYDGASSVQGTKVGNAGVITIPADSEGEACATVTVFVSSYTINNLPGSSLIPVKTVQKVCWYRQNDQAMAKFVFDAASTCRTGAVSVNVSGIFPMAQNLTQNGSNVVVGGQPQLLFQPVLHVWGALNTTLDGTRLTELQYDDQNQPINYINKYILLPADLKSTDKLSFQLDDGKLLTGELQEGYYRLSAKISVMSRFPQLVDLQGKASIAQTDVEEVQGFTEYMSLLAINGSDEAVPMQALQLNTTSASISAISSNKLGREIAEGDNVTFSWQFVGAGSQRCYHDEVLVLGACTSPMTVVAKAVSSGSSVSHVFTVAFTDVCGNQKNATYMYTQSGVTALSKIDYIPVTVTGDSTTAAAGSAAPMTRAVKSSAGGLVTSVVLGLLSLLLVIELTLD